MKPNTPVSESLMLEINKKRKRILEFFHLAVEDLADWHLSDVTWELPQLLQESFYSLLKDLNVQICPQRLSPLLTSSLLKKTIHLDNNRFNCMGVVSPIAWLFYLLPLNHLFRIDSRFVVDLFKQGDPITFFYRALKLFHHVVLVKSLK